MTRIVRVGIATTLALGIGGAAAAVAGFGGAGGAMDATEGHVTSGTRFAEAAGPLTMVQERPQERPGDIARDARRGRTGRPSVDEPPGRFPFYWTRGIYSSGGRGGFYGWGRRESWSTDFPKSDRQFVTVLKRLVRLNVSDWENAVPLDDPVLRHFPLLYMVEVGYMDLSDAEVEGLRSYLDAGGMLIVDDFWGMREWQVFEANIRRVLPDNPIVEIPLDHPLFSAYYDIDEVKQVPALGRGIFGRPTAECRGCEPAVRGIFDEDGRLLVIINWNTDLGDAWEWAEDPYYPLEYSTYAYEMGANMIVYAMSH